MLISEVPNKGGGQWWLMHAAAERRRRWFFAHAGHMVILNCHVTTDRDNLDILN